MCAVDRRLLVGSLAIAVVVSVGAGWAIAARDDDAVESIVMDEPGVRQDPTLGTNAPVQGDPLPDLVLVDTAGNDVPMSSLEGEPLIINFWYSGCVPCKKEMPVLGASADALDGKVRFVGVNVLDDGGTAQAFADEHGAGYLQLLDPNGELVSEAGVGVQPTTLFVAADGTIVKQQAGELSVAALDAAIAEAFPEVS